MYRLEIYQIAKEDIQQIIEILAVLHTSRDPDSWKRR